MTFANGNHSLAICDRCGQQYKYLQLRQEWNGLFTCPECFEPKHPQLDPPYHKADAVALQNTRSQRFQQPTTVATNDTTIADSGGITVGVANLTLPGDFAFKTQEFEVTTNGVTTTIHSMTPEDPSLQNRRRQVSMQINSVTVSIT